MCLTYVRPVLLGLCMLQDAHGHASTVPSGPRATGSVRGSVRNIDWAVIQGAALLVQGERNTRRTFTNDRGEYEIELPEGVYTITATSSGFLSGRRAAFLLRRGSDVTINLILWPAGATSHVAAVATKREFESFSGPGAANPLLDLLVEFSSRRETGNAVEYYAALATFDVLTIKADRIVLNKQFWLLLAEGNVDVDNGGHYSRPSRATVNFNRKVPDLSLTKGAIDSVSGEGGIKSGKVNFRFTINSVGSGQLYYEDKNEGISCEPVETHAFRVDDDDNGIVTFEGTCRINGIVPVPFTVTVQETKTPSEQGSFQIRIFGSSTDEYDRNGKLSRGSIQLHRSY